MLCKALQKVGVTEGRQMRRPLHRARNRTMITVLQLPSIDIYWHGALCAQILHSQTGTCRERTPQAFEEHSDSCHS